MQSDRALLDAWARSDAAAGRLLYKRYADRLARFFARKVEDDLADLVQRTFLKLLEAHQRGVGIERVDAMLFATARNELFDAFKRRRREGEKFDPEALSLEDLRTGASKQVVRHEQQRLLLGALRRLPLDDQIALELYYWEDLGMDEVAHVLGITRSAAINRIHRARARIRELVQTIEASPELREDTLTGFETWAKSLRDQK